MNITKIEILELLKEDKALQDITTEAIIVQNKMQKFAIVSKNEDPFVLCGIEAVQKTLDAVTAKYKIDFTKKDKDLIKNRETIISGQASIKELLQTERTILNLMQHLSGVATKTQNFVVALGNPNIKVLDTRKTIPYLRKFQKYAVTVGGGYNHRMDLSEMVLIKDNHIAACGGNITEAIRLAKKRAPEKRIEVECDTLEQVSEAVRAGVDVIMLDNMPVSQIKHAITVIRQNPKIKIEVSGGITMGNIATYRKADVDYLSVGSLTHSVQAIDLSLEVMH